MTLHLRRGGYIPARRLRTIAGGVDASRFADASPVDRASLGVPDDAVMLLWVGRIDPVKGLDEMIDAVALLDDRPVVLALAGEGTYQATIRRRESNRIPDWDRCSERAILSVTSP